MRLTLFSCCSGVRTKARCLVRGDLIGLKIGDVVPADCILVGPDRKQNCEVSAWIV